MEIAELPCPGVPRDRAHTRWADQHWPDTGADNPLRYGTERTKSQQARPRYHPGDKTIGSDDRRRHNALCQHGRHSFLCHRRHRRRPPWCAVHYGYLRRPHGVEPLTRPRRLCRSKIYSRPRPHARISRNPGRPRHWLANGRFPRVLRPPQWASPCPSRR